MRILITNDDGIQAPGIRLLAEWARELGEVTVVAPKTEQSGMSHAIDFTKPVEILQVPYAQGIEAYSMASTPADCIRFGVAGLGRRYDLVLSGINNGANVGLDIVYSGTVGAIFEASRFGIPAIAFSADRNGQAEAAQHLNEVYAYLQENRLLEVCRLYNVNIPGNPKGIRITRQGSEYFSDEFIQTGENQYLQVGVPLQDKCPEDATRDTVSFFGGYTSITPLMATRTDTEAFGRLSEDLN